MCTEQPETPEGQRDGEEEAEERSEELLQQDFDDLGILEVEQQIIRTALAKTISEETLTIVEAVLLREYQHKLQAKEAMRELKKQAHDRNRKNGGAL